MPLGTPWRTARRSDIEADVPARPGVYELKAFGELVYIGRADDLRTAIAEHVASKRPNGYRYDTATLLVTPRTLQRYHLERYEDRHGERPPWNRSESG